MSTTGTLLGLFVAYKVFLEDKKPSTSTTPPASTSSQPNVDNTQRDINTGLTIGKEAISWFGELFSRKSGSTKLGG